MRSGGVSCVESVGCLQLFAFCWHCCNSDGCQVAYYFDLNHKPDCNVANLRPISSALCDLGYPSVALRVVGGGWNFIVTA